MENLGRFRFRGLYPVLQTPFRENGDVDFDSLRRLVRHVRQYADGMAFPGFASEFWRLSSQEILECAAVIAREAGPGGLIFNITAEATRPAAAQAAEYRRLGASALMILPPFTVPAPAEALEAHLSALLSCAELPVVIQDSAGLTGARLDPQMIARLREKHENLAAIKVDQVPTGPSISRYRACAALTEIAYIVGYSGVQMFDAVRRGAEALMGSCGHLELDRAMLDALLSGGGFAPYRQLAPLLNFEMQSLEIAIGVHKHLLWRAGVIAAPASRQPCASLDDLHLEELRLHMEGIRL